MGRRSSTVGAGVAVLIGMLSVVLVGGHCVAATAGEWVPGSVAPMPLGDAVRRIVPLSVPVDFADGVSAGMLVSWGPGTSWMAVLDQAANRVGVHAVMTDGFLRLVSGEAKDVAAAGPAVGDGVNGAADGEPVGGGTGWWGRVARSEPVVAVELPAVAPPVTDPVPVTGPVEPMRVQITRIVGGAEASAVPAAAADMVRGYPAPSAGNEPQAAAGPPVSLAAPHPERLPGGKVWSGGAPVVAVAGSDDAGRAYVGPAALAKGSPQASSAVPTAGITANDVAAGAGVPSAKAWRVIADGPPANKDGEEKSGGGTSDSCRRVWVARDGSTFRRTLEAWVQDAGWTKVAWPAHRDNVDYPIQANAEFRGCFEDAVADLVDAFAQVDVPPSIRAHRQNGVVEVIIPDFY
jgi:hypothetical protein